GQSSKRFGGSGSTHLLPEDRRKVRSLGGSRSVEGLRDLPDHALELWTGPGAESGGELYREKPPLAGFASALYAGVGADRSDLCGQEDPRVEKGLSRSGRPPAGEPGALRPAAGNDHADSDGRGPAPHQRLSGHRHRATGASVESSAGKPAAENYSLAL